jgi:hypothetical protein
VGGGGRSSRPGRRPTRAHVAGGKGSSRATHVPLYWVLGSYRQLSKDEEDKAREAVIDALYRTGDTQLGFDMWDEGDPVLTKGAQDWAHSQGKYYYRQGE